MVRQSNINRILSTTGATKAEIVRENEQLLQVVETQQQVIDELKRQRDELTQAILEVAGVERPAAAAA